MSFRLSLELKYLQSGKVLDTHPAWSKNQSPNVTQLIATMIIQKTKHQHIQHLP